MNNEPIVIPLINYDSFAMRIVVIGAEVIVERLDGHDALGVERWVHVDLESRHQDGLLHRTVQDWIEVCVLGTLASGAALVDAGPPDSDGPSLIPLAEALSMLTPRTARQWVSALVCAIDAEAFEIADRDGLGPKRSHIQNRLLREHAAGLDAETVLDAVSLNLDGKCQHCKRFAGSIITMDDGCEVELKPGQRPGVVTAPLQVVGKHGPRDAVIGENIATRCHDCAGTGTADVISVTALRKALFADCDPGDAEPGMSSLFD